MYPVRGFLACWGYAEVGNYDDPVALRERVLTRSSELGFARVGICDARPSSHREEVLKWIADGRHGSMSYLQERMEERLDPEAYLAGARSLICVADRYHDGKRDRVRRDGPPRGRIARYARGRDYHTVMKKRLITLAKELAADFPGADCPGADIPGADFRACVDTAPILEREHAARSGLGLIGKHTLLIEPGVGSWMLLGVIVSTVKIEPTPPQFDRSDPCGSCTKCIDACPTDAITPFRVDASRCIAYTTIEHRGDIDPDIARSTGDWLFGCDICQEVCPHGQRAQRRVPPPVHEAYAPRITDLDLLEVLGWNEEARMHTLMGTAAKRATLVMWKRNAIICAANAIRDAPDRDSATAIRERIIEIAADETEDPLVRAQAQEAQ